MKKPPITKSLIALLLFFSPCYLFSQSFFGASSTPTTDPGTQAGPTVSVTPPASMQTGDLVIIYAEYRGTGVTLSVLGTGGQLWSTASNPAGATNQTFAIFWCRFNGTWGASPSITVGAGANGMSVVMYVYRPSNTSKGWAINTGPTNGSATNTAINITPGLTTTVTNSVTMAFWSSPASNTWNTLSAGWTKPGLTQYRNTTSGQSHTAAYKIMAAAGATGAVSQTQSSSQTTQTCIISWAEANPPANDLCSNGITLNSGTTCATAAGTLNYSTYTSGGGVPGCGTASADVWYSFVAKSSNPVITTTSASTQRRTELYEGSCGSLVSKACSGNSNNLNATGLVFGQTYYVRVYSNDNSLFNFNICVQDLAAANGACATATVLTPAASCTPVAGDLYLANQTNPTGGCGNYYDVWYQFTAPAGYSFANISVTPTGSPSGLNAANTFIESFKNNCTINGNSTGCNSIATVKNMAIASGTVYYFRVYTTANPNTPGTSYQYNICVTLVNTVKGEGSRMAEVFQQSILSQPGVLQYPWEVTYGPDGYLWLTEARGYKAYRVNPTTGVTTTILDISQGSATPELTPTEHTNFNVEFPATQNPWPQGGFAGLAIHPQFNSGKPYVYISYVKKYVSTAAGNAGVFFTNYLVRFTYNSGTGKLGSPVTICDTLPGSSDHNSQRVTIAPVGGTDYLYYAQGDMGAGQFGNAQRTNHAQVLGSYEGKILRFNLEPDGDGGAYDKWIPNDNPFNGANQSAVWAAGIRNNQGLVYDTSTHLLYGSSHGPYSDDEINVIERQKNYGHPYVEGFAQDGNYNGIGAGAAPNMNPPNPTSCPIIGNEVTNAAAIANYQDPLFSAYNTPTPVAPTNFTTMSQLWNQTTGANNIWPSEAWSGLDLYSNSLIPGWKRSLVAAGLKWGRLIRLKLGPTGKTTLPSGLAYGNTGDTVTYFQSTNRYRDLAFAPNGKDIYVIMDNSSATSGPGIGNPTTAGCPGCLVKYTFMGYNVNTGSANRSYIPTTIPIANGIAGSLQTANKVVINATNGNNNLWVPITDTNSNVVAEINARGYNLDTVTTTLFTRTGASRTTSGLKYVNRNMTITPQQQPADSVWIRLYISKAEFDQFVTDGGVGSISQLKIIKNEDAATTTIGLPTVLVNTTVSESFNGTSYVLQGTIGEFSSFYFSNSAIIPLPLNLLTFKGSLRNNATLLEWETANEINTSNFVVERSTDGRNFQQIGTVAANDNSSINSKYSYTDNDVTRQSSSIVYYRLKMVDNDASYTYSDIVTITLPFITSKVSLFPNPAAREVNVTITSAVDGKVKLQLIDNTGRTVIHSSLVAKKGNNNIMINLNRLSSGTYFLIVSGANIDEKVKLEKL